MFSESARVLLRDPRAYFLWKERIFAMIPTTASLFDCTHTLAAPLLEKSTYPWEILGQIKDFVLALGKTLSPDEYDSPSENVWIAKDVKIAPTASITGPLHHRKGYRNPPRRVYPRERTGRGGLRHRQLDRAEKCHHLRLRAGAPLQLCRRFGSRLPFPYGSGRRHFQRQVG